MSGRRDQAPILLDLGQVGRNEKGVARVLTALAPRLVALAPARYHVACTRLGAPRLTGVIAPDRITVAPSVPQSVWEQAVFPAAAARIGAGVAYSHQECGPLWGIPLVLHVPEDPEVRWAREPTTDRRELMRRRYSRTVMNRSLRRSRVVVSTRSTAMDLVANHGVDEDDVTVVPLGVDLEVFRCPTTPPAGEPYFFHLASKDPRDRTDLIISGFGRFRAMTQDAVTLTIAGRIGGRLDELRRLAVLAGCEDAVTFRGEVSDAELRELYGGTVASVHASPDEGFGLQPLEAMACGALLVSTPAPAVAEVTSGAGVVWTEPDPRSLASALRSAWSDDDRRQRSRLVNRACAERLSWDTTACRLHRLLLELGGKASEDLDDDVADG